MRIVYSIILSTFTFKISKNQGLTNSLADMNNVLGAKNLLPNNAESLTYGGITFTVNSDGSVTANGTATELVLLFYVQKFKPNNGNYILSGGIRNGAFVFVNENNGTTFVRNIVSIGNDTQFTLNYSDYDNLDCGVGIESGVTVNNETFYPMLRPASIQDDTYVPYSMTNREMTPYVQVISNPNLLDNPWFTVNQRGQSSYSYSGGSYNYTVDRWFNNYHNGVVTVGNGVTLNNYKWFCQLLNADIVDLLEGKTVTASVMLSDGTIISGTKVFHADSITNYVVISSGENAIIRTSNLYNMLVFEIVNFAPAQGEDLTIRAVKLELGSVSTLAQDVAPNYAIELAKCRTSTADSSDTYANQGKISISKEDDDYWISDSFGTNTSIAYIRKNNIVTVSIAWWNTGSTIKNSDVIYTLPVKYRPGVQIFTINTYLNQNSNICIGSDGKINVETNNQSGIIDYGRATISYIVV